MKEPLYHHKKAILSGIIFILVFCILGLPFGNWGFIGDDFGNILHSQLQSWYDAFRLFYEGNACSCYQASNFVAPDPTFFNIYYRPFAFIFNYLISLACGINAYGYFLFFILFHAINSVLIFNIFCWIIKLDWAFLLTLLFAFHPSLGSWFGWGPALQQIINLTFILLILILFKKYLASHSAIIYLLSVFIFLISLFTRETFLVLPFLLTIGLFFYFKKSSFFKTLCQNLVLTSGFWVTAFFYILTRLYFFPLKISTHADAFRPRVFDLISFLSDLACLSYLPQNNRPLKGLLLVCFFTFLFFLFLKNTEKSLIIFLSFSLIIFMWPAILKQYLPRHLYEIGLFMFLLILMALFKFSKTDQYKNNIALLGIAKAFMCIFLLFNIFMLTKSMKATETFAYKLKLAHDQLCANPEIRNKILCFVELPCSQIKGGVAQAIWMRGVNKNLPILELEFPLKILKEEYDGIIPTHKRFLEFAYHGNQIYGHTQKPGIIAFDGQEDTSNSVNAVITIDPKYTGDSLFFIGWDYKNFQFVKINSIVSDKTSHNLSTHSITD